MKKRIRVFFILFILFFFFTENVLAKTPPSITAQSALVIDVKSGSVLYSKNGDKTMYPASTTKILTGIISLEFGDLEDIVKITPQSAAVGEASINLRAGDEIKLHDLLKGALIKSGNDAAHALGEFIAGDEQLFVYLMNKKAIILGSEKSNFCNTNGLPNDNHVTTARDLAYIARYAMHNDVFKNIVKLKTDTIEFTTGEKRYLKNTNKLLWNYQYADGVKTGTTNKAGNCLVASASQKGNSYIAVILKSYDRYGDAQKLLEYAFNNYKSYYIPQNSSFGKINIKNGKKNSVKLSIPHDLVAICESEEFSNLKIKKQLPSYLKAPVNKGQKIGKVEIILNDDIIDSAPIIASEDVPAKSLLEILFSQINSYIAELNF